VTYFAGYESTTQTLLHATFIQYDPTYHPQLIIISDRAHYEPPTWTFHTASEYHFNADGTIQYSQEPEQQVDIGQKPSQIDEIITNKNREEMSRSQLREVIESGQLTPAEVRAYQTTYEEKLARPFASFVFTLLAVPFGLRPVRGGGGTGLGFGLAVLIVFVYFVIASIISALTTSLPGGFVVSTIGAWLPNLIFVAIGAVLLRRAAAH
jgi:lipopolysaccharide export system permease protein